MVEKSPEPYVISIMGKLLLERLTLYLQGPSFELYGLSWAVLNRMPLCVWKILIGGENREKFVQVVRYIRCYIIHRFVPQVCS